MLRKIGIAAAIVCSQFVVALVVREVPVFADGNPATNDIANRLAYSGRVELDGQPYNGVLRMEFELYDGAEGGIIYSELQTASVSNGAFSVQLGETGNIGAIIARADDLHLGIRILGTDTTTFATPIALQNRQRIVPAAYAFHAQQAVDLTVNRDLFVARDAVVLGSARVDGELIVDGGIQTSTVLANGVLAGVVEGDDVVSHGDVVAEGNMISSADVVGRNVVVSPTGGEISDFGILRSRSNGFEIFAGSQFVARVFADGDVTFDRGVVASSGLQYLGATSLRRTETANTAVAIDAANAVVYDITEQNCPNGAVMVGAGLITGTETINFGFGSTTVATIALQPRCTAVP